MHTKLSIKNFKLIENLEAEFSSGNVYLIKGKNEVGKSTLLEAFKSLFLAKLNTKEPVTKGKEETQIIGIIEDKNGNNYSISLDATPDGKSKFTLVNQDGIKTTSVTNIRDIFQYTDFTAEEFVSWGKTAEGKRKQVEILLQCLPKVLIEKYKELEQKEKISYDKRTPVLSDFSYLSKKIKDTVLDNDTINLVEKDNEEVRLEIEKKLSQKANYDIEVAKYNAHINSISEKRAFNESRMLSFDKVITETETEIKRLTDKLNALKEEKKQFVENVELENKRQEEVKAPEPIAEEDYQKAMQMKDILDNAERNYTEYNKLKEEFKQVESKKVFLDDEIDLLRADKAQIIQSSKLFDNVTVEEDTIYVTTEHGTFPLSDSQIATSIQMMLAVKILLKLNDKFPVVCVGRGESFDNSKLLALKEIAKEEDAIIFVEKVMDDGELKIEAIIEE